MINIDFPYEKYSFLSNRIFEDLSRAELKILHKNLITRTYKKGEYLFEQGEIPSRIFVVKKGKVKKFITDSSGNEQIFYVCKDGDLLGYQSLLSEEQFPCSASAMEDSSISFIPKADFLRAIQESTFLLKTLLKISSHEFGVLVNCISFFAQRTARQRLALSLILLREKYKRDGVNKPVELSLSRDDLSKYVGTARETIVRLLHEFKDEELIELKGRNIIIKNPTQLSKEATLF